MDKTPVILVVDDEPAVLQMLQTLLQTMHYQVLTASSGQKALEIITCLDPVINLVLTDIRMPEMDGIELHRQIQKFDASMPVIMMTGYTDFDMVVEALRLHTFDLIFKPIELEQLSWCLVKANHYIKYQQVEKDYLQRLEKQVAEQTAILRQQVKDLEEARAAAGAVDTLKRDFLSIISHELRTPMNGILGATQLLEMEDTSDSQADYIRMLRTASEHMLTMVNNLLTLTQTKALDPQKGVDQKTLEHALESLLARYQAKASAKGVQFESSIGGVCVLPLKGPWESIQIVAGSLLDNAIKFTDAGGTVRCSLRATPDSPASSDMTLTLQVTDTGIGIPPDHRETIFQPFTQVEPFMTRNQGGIGIGLSIVRTICDKLGGNLTLSSEPGTGSCFSCAFPVKIGTTPPL